MNSFLDKLQFLVESRVRKELREQEAVLPEKEVQFIINCKMDEMAEKLFRLLDKVE